MERRPVSIPRAEIPVEAIRYSDVKSRVEIASVTPPIVNFRNANMKVLYEDLGMSSKSVGSAVGLSTSQSISLLHNQGVVMRDSNDPIYTDRRIEASRRAYLDPLRKAEIAAKIHSPGSDIKRSKSMTQKYETDVEYRERQLGYIRSAGIASIRARAERRKQRAFESLERERLKRVKDTEFAIKLLENPALGRLSPQQKRVVELRFRTDGGPALTLEQVGEAMGGISRQAVQQHEAAAFVKLGIVNKSGKRSSQKIGVKK